MRLCEYFVKLKVKTPNTRKYKHTYTYIYINTRFQKRCNLKIYIKYIWVPELNYPWWNSFAHCTPWLVYKLVRLYPSSRRAGPRSLLALRHVRFSARARGNVCGKGMALLMSLASSICLFVFFFSSLPHTYFIMSEETPVQKCWYWRPTRKLLPINQPIRGGTKLKSRLDCPCFPVSNHGDYFQLS